MIKISKRLQNIANLCEEEDNIIDIGCDHGLLDIYIIQNKKNTKIIASDINEQALKNAKEKIKNYKLEKYIKIIKSDGLEKINTENYNTIIIAGMGSHTIAGILYRNIKKLKNIKNLIIQSNNDIDFLRKKIIKLGYYIEKETLIKEKNIIYTIIKFKKGHKYYSKKELYFGPYLLKHKDELFEEKNNKELIKLKKIYKLIPKKNIHHRLVILSKIKLYSKL